ncbi:carbohydrate ABC transporter permease [Paenibacillus sp. JCM 10914]|uniref:carbohydrate ABC transporter permease n=1 Tax=Paenibacillus sp. JCM 10914 TaxID=1236974 RepID=UPI0003CC4D6D|nr:carbohydrate ABC transporter permease [Paenibacillus sp. JCM 10914]GAE06099.1 N-Acetyl-D-glucosamine ABC transport system, permease protein 2 [Paenibacillus sp. JCM 10914]
MVGPRFNLRNISWFQIINTLILLSLAVITVYPVVYITAVSLSETSEVIQGNVTLFPKGFNLDAYAQVLTDNRVPRAYMNTIFYTALGTAINLLLTSVAAYPLARKNMFGRKFFLLAIIMTMFLNPGIIPNYLVVSELGLLDSVWALVLPNAIWTFELLILKSFYENMSESLREAAVVDGASEYRILFRIMIPLSKPALASIGLFYFMGHWNSFFIPMIYLNDANMYPLQVVLRDMLIFSDGGNNASLVDSSALAPQAMKNATIVLSMIPVLLIYPFAQKYFAKGVMLGSEKG